MIALKKNRKSEKRKKDATPFLFSFSQTKRRLFSSTAFQKGRLSLICYCIIITMINSRVVFSSENEEWLGED